MIARSNEPFIGFAGLKEFREIKAELRKLSGSDKAYYDRLAQFQVEHADQIASASVERKVRDALAQELNYWRWETANDPPPPEPKPAKARKLFAFTAADQFAEIKRHLNWLTGNDATFETIMRKHGFADISEIKDRNAGYPALRELSAERNRLQIERGMGHCDDELQDLLQRSLYQLEHKFWQALGAFNCGTFEQVFALPSDELQKLLRRLKDESERKDKNSGPIYSGDHQETDKEGD